MADAVTSFQRRHGLAADGTVGKATLAQLQVPPAARARQIVLSLDRLRWTPLLQGPRMIVINVPEFVLRAYEVQGDRILVRETMKIIVGKSMDTRTPLFEEQMRFIEFQPYWNVPPSIARGEIVPRLRRDPGYFDREGFEFVTAQGQVVAALAPEMLDAVHAGRARIRQRPGPRNALGDIKFVFPNRENIYLHHTPSAQLFERDRRDFSHGCIRVELPVALAMFVLRGLPDWTEARIRQAMAEGNPSTVRLAEPIPVVIAYATAIVKDGRIHFFDDIYGHDNALDAALSQPRPPLMTRP
jgi:murein L,D-transpeptidase YcbB/YkuD